MELAAAEVAEALADDPEAEADVADAEAEEPEAEAEETLLSLTMGNCGV